MRVCVCSLSFNLFFCILRWWRSFASISARVESTLPDDFSYLYPLSFSGKWGLKWSESFKHKEQDQDNDHRYICMKGMCACVRIFVLFNASTVHGNVLLDYQKWSIPRLVTLASHIDPNIYVYEPEAIDSQRVSRFLIYDKSNPTSIRVTVQPIHPTYTLRPHFWNVKFLLPIKQKKNSKYSFILLHTPSVVCLILWYLNLSPQVIFYYIKFIKYFFYY